MSYKAFGITLPDELVESIDRYVSVGCPTGGFLQAVIENDLAQAVGRADQENIHRLPAIVSYLYNECPASCWGSADHFEYWIEHRGLQGLKEVKESQ